MATFSASRQLSNGTVKSGLIKKSRFGLVGSTKFINGQLRQCTIKKSVFGIVAANQVTVTTSTSTPSTGGTSPTVPTLGQIFPSLTRF
ncbi:hypothetical protein NIES4103_31310 [Nostoc sp. NIES-4103]|nr:hypothetical protein NIES4103_31310 [Nostoc sp. NIES-4103]